MVKLGYCVNIITIELKEQVLAANNNPQRQKSWYQYKFLTWVHSVEWHLKVT